MSDAQTPSATRRASVVIPTRGGRDRLHWPLDALRKQTVPVEVVVVVDGDVDGTEDLLRRYRDEGMETLRWHVFEENQGRSRALNHGFAMAEGDVLIRCDDDLEPAPDFVERHVAAHEGQEYSGAVGLTLNVYPDGPYAEAYGRPAARQHVDAALASPPETHWKHWAANCSITRAAHEVLGGYDEDYRRYGWEDVDMGYRVHSAGYPVRIHEELTTPHYGPALTTRARAVRALHSGAARELFEQKHGTEALGGPGRPGGAWGLAVRALAAVSTEPVVERVSRAVDAALPRVPHAVGRKLVALTVEAAGRSGVLHPARARTTF